MKGAALLSLETGPTSPAPSLKDMDSEERVTAMVEWFRSNFEDPVHSTPYNGQEGGYQYIWGGPYETEDQLLSAFDGFNDEELEAAVSEIEEDGTTDWAPASKRIQEVEDFGGTDDDLDDEDGDTESLVDRVGTLSREIEDLDHILRSLPTQPPQAGHNNPPEEFRIGLDEAFVLETRADLAEVKAELAKTDALHEADPAVIAKSESTLRKLYLKVAGWIKFASTAIVGGVLSGVGKDLLDDPVGLLNKVHHVSSTLSDWVVYLKMLH